MNEWMGQTANQARERLLADCGLMKTRLVALLDSHGKVANEVHAIRKLGKSLRGGMHLFRLGGTAAKEIQVIGRMLSAPRDAVSRLSTWRKLEWNEDAGVAGAVDGLLEQHVHAAARRPPQLAIDWCLARVDEAGAALSAIPPEDLATRMEEGIRKLRKKLKRRASRLEHRAEEDFHEARKAVKAWLGAMALLPEEFVLVDPECHELAEILGDENDLATLSDWLEGHGFTDRFAPGLWHCIGQKRLVLQRKAVSKARLLKM